MKKMKSEFVADRDLVEFITEHELVEIRIARVQLAELRAQERQLAARLADLEGAVVNALGRGAVVMGRLTAIVEKTPGKCSPKWKDEYLNHLEAVHGEVREGAEERVRAEYPAEPKEILVIGEAPLQAK